MEATAPAMRKDFTTLSALGLGFSITNSWVGYLSCFGQNLAYAGPQSAVFGLLAAVAVQWIITLGLSEISSAFPTSGGQYHYVYALAPKQLKHFASFVIGWMNLLGWAVTLCSGISVTTQSVSGLLYFLLEDFSATGVQLYLIYFVTAALSILPLFLSRRWLPKILQASLVFSVVGFLLVLTVVLSVRKQQHPLSFVTRPQLGWSGWDFWPSWIMGIGNAMYAFGAADAVIHIAEETKTPELDIPFAMFKTPYRNLTLVVGILTTFPLFFVMMLSIRDTEAIANAQLPYAELLYQITGSKPLTTFMIVWVTITTFTAIFGQWVTCGRLAWSIARDHGLPYSEYFQKISDRFNFPVRTTLMTWLFCSVYGLLYLFNTTAFNSIITSSVLYMNITYIVPQALLAVKDRSKALPSHPFNLGFWGHICNILAPVLVVTMGVFICLPPKLPVTAESMNYTPLILVVLFLIITVAWCRIGPQFKGPDVDWYLPAGPLDQEDE